MLTIHTIFDYKRPVPWPLATGVYNPNAPKDKQFTYIDLYRPGPTTTLDKVQDRINKLKKIIETQACCINDFKAHIDAFKITPKLDYKVYNRPGTTQVRHTEKECMRDILLAIKAAKEEKPQAWQLIEAKAHVVYAMMEKNGIYDGIKTNHPHLDTHVLSGRGRSTGFNMHGMGDKNVVYPRSEGHCVFIHCDWISADLRAASILADDRVLQNFFEHSDPYERIAEELNEDRETCKIMMLKALYSLNYDAQELRFYAKFQKWIEESVRKLKKDGYVTSILGRKFKVADVRAAKKEKTQIQCERAVFNAAVQGTVAHAMNLTLYRVAQTYPANLLSEHYDSIVLTCDRASVKSIVSDVGNIMLRPFKKVLKEDPTFPVRVSIGMEWRKWKPIREFR